MFSSRVCLSQSKRQFMCASPHHLSRPFAQVPTICSSSDRPFCPDHLLKSRRCLPKLRDRVRPRPQKTNEKTKTKPKERRQNQFETMPKNELAWKVRLGFQGCRNKSETLYDRPQDGESGCCGLELNGAWLCHSGSGCYRGSHWRKHT